MSETPPAHVQKAAATVQAWLDAENAKPLSAEQIAALPADQRLDYTRVRSQQQQMPNWKDPRG